MVGFAVHCKSRDKKRREEGRRPEWVALMLRIKFFEICDVHRDLRKSEMNTYCIDCNCCLCPHCLAPPPSAAVPHRGHRKLQIRRYVYQDVIRVHDIHKLTDCSKVQTYTVNSAKVVLLNPRTQSKTSKLSASGAACEICGRGINEPNRYCSMACKVAGDDVEGGISSDVDNGAACNRSEPFLPSLTSDLEAYSPRGEESSSCLSSPPPSDSGEENLGRQKRRRKGDPQRSPLF